MNSYPPELLAQLAPVMFVAGLDAPPTAKPQDPFAILSVRLRDALVAQRKPAIWQPDKSKTLQVVLVDKDVKFPPRKLLPPDDSQYHASHSPLSPLTPTSPLYPDGLIAPIWTRKHTTLVPSVFVVFMRLFEYGAGTAPGAAEGEREQREAEERRRDSELASEIALRKRSTNERAIKLTVVLLASRRMLDDTSLDSRLTFIRRQSGLDPRAALFVLSPVSQSEIGDFVRSLQEALHEPAIEYYTNHSKRVRRKRNRHSQAASYAPPLSPVSAPNVPRPLRPEGWTVRYEYKMACFAEFRGEDEIALKHYQDAYSSLLVMFGSTAILPPRTKRWAEAKVLADCINLKVCKLYLYNNEHSMALSYHNSHMRKFADLSRGWGIGDETYEFWSWLARQHRAFAELLEQGLRSTLKLPTEHNSASVASAMQAMDSTQRAIIESDGVRGIGINPYQALQHPGFYYYMAARCTERRRDRFLTALESEAGPSAPGFVNENKVDHLALILELYTRAYELFKKHGSSTVSGQGRLTLWIAYLIALTYQKSGKFDMAVRFFERIAKTYRRENWKALLRPLLSAWYACAQQTGDMELSVKLLFEMIGNDINQQDDDPDALQEDLLAVLKTSVPSTPDEPFVIDPSDSEPILDASIVFWKQDVSVGEPVAFQLSLASREAVSMSSLPWASLAIHFSSDLPPIVIQQSAASDGEILAVSRVALPHLSSNDEGATRSADGMLRWGAGTTTVLTGSITSDVPANIKISRLVLTLKQGGWIIEVPISLAEALPGNPTSPRWLVSTEPVHYMPVRGDHHSTVTVHHRPHMLHVSLSHESPAYVGEDYPIKLEVTNSDEKSMDVVVDVLLQPSELDEVEELNYILIGDERSTALIKGVSLGVLAPGVTSIETLQLGSRGLPGDRVIDISVQSQVAGAQPNSPQSPSASLHVHRGEILRTLVVPVVDAIKGEHQIIYRRSLHDQAGSADLQTYDEEFWDDGGFGEAVVTTLFTCSAPSGVVIKSIAFKNQDGPTAKITDSSLDESEYPTELLNGDELCVRCCISLASNDQYVEDNVVPGPGVYEVLWNRLLPDGTYGSVSTSLFRLPQLQPPTEGLVALLQAPSTAKLHAPITLQLTVRNRHPSRSANVIVQLEPDSADGFVVAGLRSGRLPILLPGGEEKILWKLIPIDCGFVKIPHFRVTDRRKVIDAQLTGYEPEDEGDVIRVIDVHWDGQEAGQDGTESSGSPRDPVILVLP